MSQQALTGLPVYDFYEIDKYIHSKEFRNKVVLEALGTEIEIISVGGIGNYVKQKYLQYLDSLEVTDVYYGFGYTAGVLVDIIIGDYLESELAGAVFKDTFNTAQAAPKAEKAVAESGEEVLDQAEKAAGKVVEESGEEILEQTGKAIETSYGKSSEIIQCNTKDAVADELAKRIGGQSRSAFADDPIQREFDVISDQYIAQAKPPLKCVNKTVRTQMKATFEAAKKYGRKVYYQFEGIPSQEVLDKLYEYSERYGVEVIIDTEPLGVLN